MLAQEQLDELKERLKALGKRLDAQYDETENIRKRLDKIERALRLNK